MADIERFLATVLEDRAASWMFGDEVKKAIKATNNLSQHNRRCHAILLLLRYADDSTSTLHNMQHLHCDFVNIIGVSIDIDHRQSHDSL